MYVCGSKSNSDQKWNNKTCQCECKIYQTIKKIIVGILADVFVRMVNIQEVLLTVQ